MTCGSSHYWASEDLNTTGENVGITLDSMCDIIAANDVTNGNTVVFVPGDIEKNQKGHFELGEGGSSAEIDADLYQVLTGDGEGNGIGAQGGSSATEDSKIYLKDKRLGPNIPTQEDGGFYIQDVDTGSFTITSNALNHTHAETIYDEEEEQDVEIEVEDDSWKLTLEDYGKMKVSGGATVNIGETGIVYGGVNLGKFWDKSLKGPEVDIAACAKVEMIGNGQNNATPVLSMRGNCIIDMADESTQSGTKTHNPYYLNAMIRNYMMNNIFNFKDNRNSAPILQMKDKATVSLTDLSILQMKDTSTVIIQGDCLFKMSGWGYSEAPTDYGHVDGEAYPTAVYIQPNSVVNIDGATEYNKQTSVLEIMPNQLIMGSAWGRIPMTSSSSGEMYDIGSRINTYCYATDYYFGTQSTYGYLSCHDWDGDQGKYAINKLTWPTSNATSYVNNITSAKSSYINNISGPGILIEGKSAAHIGGDGIANLTVSPQGDSLIHYAINTRYTGDIYSNHTGVESGMYIEEKNVCGARVMRKFGATGNYSSQVLIHGTVDLAFSPGTCFGVNANPVATDITANWSKFQGIFDGNDTFIQVDGNTHLESWSGTVILRGQQTNPFFYKEEKCYPYFLTATTSSGEEGSATKTFQSKNDTDTVLLFTKEELLESYQDWIKQASPCPGTSDNPFAKYVLTDINPYTVELTNDSGGYFEERGLLKGIVTYEKYSFYAFDISYRVTQFTTVDQVIDYYNDTVATSGLTTAIKDGMRIKRIIKTSSSTFSKSYSNGYYNYYLRYVYVEREYYGTTAINLIDNLDFENNRIYNPTTDSKILSSLTQTQQDWFKSVICHYLGSTGTAVIEADLDYSNAEVSKYYFKQFWKLTCVSIWKLGKSHLQKEWKPILQTKDYVGTEDWEKAPIIQAYGPVNCLLRGKYSNSLTYDFESEETYDVSNQQQAIEDFIAGPDYAGLEDHLALGDHEVWKILTISSSEPGSYSVNYSYKDIGWNEHLESYPDYPVVEITDDSEVRFYDGSRVKGFKPQFGETTFEFSSSDPNEGSVSFTISELQALKALISNT